MSDERSRAARQAAAQSPPLHGYALLRLDGLDATPATCHELDIVSAHSGYAVRERVFKGDAFPADPSGRALRWNWNENLEGAREYLVSRVAMLELDAQDHGREFRKSIYRPELQAWKPDPEKPIDANNPGSFIGPLTDRMGEFLKGLPAFPDAEGARF